MYLSDLDVIGISIALITSVSLIITSATANARLTRSRDFWRSEAIRLERIMDEISPVIKKG